MQIRHEDKCCTCYNVDIEKLIYQSKSTLDSLSQKRAHNKAYGYSFSPEGFLKLDVLTTYLGILEDEYLNISFGGKPCLDCNNLQLLAEKVRKITINCDTSLRRDLKVDNSKENEWISKNPYCVSREKWEELAYRICADFKLELKSTEIVCDISFEIIRKLIPCDIMVSIAVYKQQCDLDLEISRTEEECDIDFEILSQEVECDLDLKMYKTLVENNFSYDIIRTVYENGCTIEVNDSIVPAEIHLVTPLKKYPIKDLNFKGIPDLKILKSLGVDTSDSKYIKDPNNFIQKLKQDYK